jgi:hypothetical protein
MKFQIKNRWSAQVIFECELSAEVVGLSYGMQLGFAVREALRVGSNLSGSDLRGSDLSGSNLSGSNLTPIRDDFWAVLSATPLEVGGLRAALVAGRVDGSTYEGECACLVGTIANVRDVKYDTIDVLRPNSSRPIERFFMGIRKGDTPETNQVSALVLEWLDIWVANMKSAFHEAS